MEFWGVEVKAGQPLKVQPGEEKMIHISQVALGETKKETGNDSILVFLKVDNQKMVIGTLSAKNIPQISFDLVFGKEFELSHNWKNGSLYFCGYKADSPDEEESSYYSDSDNEEEADVPANVVPNGIAEPKKEKAKPAAVKDNAKKVKSNVAVAKKEATSDTNSDTEDEDIKDDSESDDLTDSSDDSLDGSSADDSMDEDEETPKKVESSKKRATESTSTPVPAKKVKLATPQKTDAKKGTAHVATPHPSKQASKTPATTSEKSKGAATPKSAGTVTCGSCSKKFNSEGALQSHSKAKHEAK